MHRIRTAGLSDRAAVIRIQLDSWRDTYTGVLDDSFLEHDLPGELETRWRADDFGGADRTLIVEGPDGEALGFIATEDSSGQLYVHNLHVAPRGRGQGLGTMLLHEAACVWLARGATRAHLHVLERNARTLAYYQRLGGTPGPMFREQLFGQPVRTVPVTWDDLSRLQRLSAPR